MITTILVLFTAIVSMVAFNNRTFFEKLTLSPYKITHQKEFYRIITSGFIHADWMHLLVNMFVLWSFGNGLQSWFNQLENMGYIGSAPLQIVILYFGGLIISSLSTIFKHKNNYYYNAVGASGAVSAVVFATIFFNPWESIYLFAILPIPGILFGAAYLWYSNYMSKKDGDNINHEAHFYGAIFGLIYPILIDPSLALHFLRQLITFR